MMNIMKIATVLFFVTCDIGICQEFNEPYVSECGDCYPYRLKTYYGLTGGYGYSYFGVPNSIACTSDAVCPEFDALSGGGIFISGFYEREFARKWSVRSTLSYYHAGGESKKTVDDVYARDRIGDVVPLVREHTLEMFTLILLGDVSLNWNFFDNFVLNTGITAGYYLDRDWQATSTIVSPENVFYPNGEKSVTYLERQPIKDPQTESEANPFYFAGTIGLGYKINSMDNDNAKLDLIPEISFSYPVFDFHNELDLSHVIARAGLSVRININKKRTCYEETDIEVSLFDMDNRLIIPYKLDRYRVNSSYPANKELLLKLNIMPKAECYGIDGCLKIRIETNDGNSDICEFPISSYKSIIYVIDSSKLQLKPGDKIDIRFEYPDRRDTKFITIEF